MKEAHRHRSLTIPPERGRMGTVMLKLREHGGMTKSAIEEVCAESGLTGGSIERMVTYAKNEGLLLADQVGMFDEPAPPPSIPVLEVSSMATTEELEEEGEAEEGGEVASPAVQSEMRPEVLILLMDNQMACTLAVAWQFCEGKESDWLDIAGVKPYHASEAMKLCKALRRMHICRDGGVTDRLAIRYITTLVTEPLARRARSHDNKNKANDNKKE